MNQVLLSTAYFAPTLYYSCFVNFDKVFIEQHENYSRQSFRNRCIIYSANGLLALSVPVEKSDIPKIPIKEVRIANNFLWQKNHFKAIESAYRNSPYYEYYIDFFLPFFEKKYSFLFDFNIELHQVVLKLLNIEKEFFFTNKFIKEFNEGVDFRTILHPKKNIASDFFFKPYNQVFSDRFGFIPNLSVLDVLFNVGNEAISYLPLLA